MKVRCNVTREQVEDLKACYGGIDAERELEAILSEEINKQIINSEFLNGWLVDKTEKKEIKRVYSNLDPYGEENWEE